MNLYVLTVLYGPIDFLEKSLEHNYNLFKKENIKFKHYLLDNNFPLENSNHDKQKIKNICNKYNIFYLNTGKNLGMIGSQNFFAQEIQKEGILFNLEYDSYIKSNDLLKNIIKLHQTNISNLVYLNTDYLNDYDKKIFSINDTNLFELELKNDYKKEWQWVQSFSVNIELSLKINEILLQKKDNYDVPGESSSILKSKGFPMLVMNDFYDNMNQFRYANYLEYQYYKALIYHWSKIDENLSGLTFEFFLKNYDYYLYLHYFVHFINHLNYDLEINPKLIKYKFLKTQKQLIEVMNYDPRKLY
jgi:hypothetical protein